MKACDLETSEVKHVITRPQFLHTHTHTHTHTYIYIYTLFHKDDDNLLTNQFQDFGLSINNFSFYIKIYQQSNIILYDFLNNFLIDFKNYSQVLNFSSYLGGGLHFHFTGLQLISGRLNQR